MINTSMTETTAKKNLNREIYAPQPVEIPFVDLKRQYADYKYEIRTAINRVLNSGIYTSGSELGEFEAEYAAYCGVKYCSGVSDGKQALKIAFQALGIHAGDEVVTVANAGMHSTNAILEIGAVPHFAEINPVTMIMTLEGLTRAITANTKAVIITHLYGLVADMEGFSALTSQFNLALIEDCFQAHGAKINGQSVGTWGDIGCFGFSPARNLGALGDAGAIITNNPTIAHRVEEIIEQGEYLTSKANFSMSNSSSMDEIQAAVLRAKLPLLDEMNLKRRMIAQAYMINLEASNSRLGFQNHHEKSVYQNFVVRTPHREMLKKRLQEKSIGWAVHYPQADYLNSACLNLGYQPGMLPATEQACAEVISLPCFPELAMGEVEKVCTVVNETLEEIKD
jgi:dTDP-4-amino-4,6-dideoxygalactose transaminase